MNKEKLLNEINELQARIGQTDYEREDYKTYLEELKMLNDLYEAADKLEMESKAEKRKLKMRILELVFDIFKTAIGALSAVGITLLIISAEESVPKILNSKAFSFIGKCLPKVV